MNESVLVPPPQPPVLVPPKYPPLGGIDFPLPSAAFQVPDAPPVLRYDDVRPEMPPLPDTATFPEPAPVRPVPLGGGTVVIPTPPPVHPPDPSGVLPPPPAPDQVPGP